MSPALLSENLAVSYMSNNTFIANYAYQIGVIRSAGKSSLFSMYDTYDSNGAYYYASILYVIEGVITNITGAVIKNNFADQPGVGKYLI